MAKGKLSVTEKYVIQGMLHDNKTVAEIAELTGRTPQAIEQYIERELRPIQESIAAIQARAVEPVVEEKPRVVLPDEMVMEVMHKLRGAGLYKEDAEEVLKRTTRRLNRVPDNSHQMFVYCIKSLNAKDVMNTHTASGKKGVAIMNAAGSQRGDENRASVKPGTSRTSKGNVFQPKDNKMRE